MFQHKLPGQSDPIEFTFTVRIVSAKKIEVTEFNPHAPGIEYIQYVENNCCFSSLESAMFASG